MTPGSGPWSVVALLSVVVLLPTAGVLWFMDQAVRNERFAVRQRLSEAYQVHLAGLENEFSTFWRQRAGQLESAGEGAAAFARCVREGWSDSAVIYGLDGELAYPAVSQPQPVDLGELQADWTAAERLEALGDSRQSATAWGELADRASDPQVTARALQGQLRSLVQGGQVVAAVTLATERLSAPELAAARDARGRLIAPSALLLALRLLTGAAPDEDLNGDDAGQDDRVAKDGRITKVVARLHQRLSTYEEPFMPASQRRFLARQLQPYLAADQVALDTGHAEELAARYVDSQPSTGTPSVLEPSGLPGVWRLASPTGRVIGLYDEASVRSQSLAVPASSRLPVGTALRLLPPGGAVEEGGEVVAALELQPPLAGWSLVLLWTGDDGIFDLASRRQIATYRWAGVLLVLGILLLAGLVAARLTAQMRLTELKNDFLANVSHELKTPLASTRLLVDTLLDPDLDDEKSLSTRAREYLELIAAENLRLSRLVESFLSFSRMEHGRAKLELSVVAASEIAEAAAAASRDRIAAVGSRLELKVGESLPNLTVDREAVVSVLVNLLDNACKFAPEDPGLTLAVTATDGHVDFAVEDHGVGIPKRSLSKIFDRFYQVDQRLSRQGGGTGLGLSIVRHIVEAHGGTVTVDSEIGRGSTFTVRLPVTSQQELLTKEVPDGG